MNPSRKPAAHTVPPADLTKDIDDDWADDDDETGGVPTVTASKSPSAAPTRAEAAGEAGAEISSAGESKEPKRSISGTLPALKQDSDAPGTDEIDSDWPDEDQAAALPKIPKQGKLPDIAGAAPIEATSVVSAGAKASISSAPSTVPPTSASFEQAAQRLAEESAFSHSSWEVEQADDAAPESSDSAKPEAAKSGAETKKSAAAKTSEKAPASSSGEKRKSPLFGIAVAAAAILVVGFALQRARSSRPAAEPTAQNPSTTKTVVQTAKDPDAKRVTPEPEKRDPEKAPDKAADQNAVDEKPSDDPAAPGDDATATEKVLVHLAVSPEDAEIYQKGQRIGKGQVRVEIDPNDRTVLLLVREGYWPRKVILDGSEKYVNVGMRTKPEDQASAPINMKTAPPLAKKPPTSKPPTPTRTPVPHGGSTAPQAPSIGR